MPSPFSKVSSLQSSCPTYSNSSCVAVSKANKDPTYETISSFPFLLNVLAGGHLSTRRDSLTCMHRLVTHLAHLDSSENRKKACYMKEELTKFTINMNQDHVAAPSLSLFSHRQAEQPCLWFEVRVRLPINCSLDHL